MPNWLHRTTKQFLQSVSPNSLQEPVANYIQEPDLSAVVGFDSIYWIITGDIVTLMSLSERAAVDAQLLADQIQTTRDAATLAVDTSPSEVGLRERAMIELHNKRINYTINRLIELQNRVQAMLDSTGGVANMRIDGLAISISATSTRSKPVAVTDFKDDINAGNND